MDPMEQIAELSSLVRDQMAELDRLRPIAAEVVQVRAERDRLRAEVAGLVAFIQGDADALGCLQAIYSNPRTSEANRIRAASSALAFERPKLSVVATGAIPSLARILRDEPKLIEAKPEPAA
jgi:hypothetical protein